MNDQIFWELIEQSKKEAHGDLEAQYELIVSKLSQYSPEEILAYDKIFNKYYVESYSSDLWAAAYIILGGCSDDGFDYFRAWLISRGRKVYEDALRDPESLVDIISEEEPVEGEFEEFLYAASEAYKAKTGKDDFYDRAERAVFPKIDLSWSEDSEELAEKYTRLAEVFW